MIRIRRLLFNSGVVLGDQRGIEIQRRDRWRLEYRAQWQFHFEQMAEMRHDSAREQGMAAKLEEVVMSPHALDVQQFLPDLRRLL